MTFATRSTSVDRLIPAVFLFNHFTTSACGPYLRVTIFVRCLFLVARMLSAQSYFSECHTSKSMSILVDAIVPTPLAVIGSRSLSLSLCRQSLFLSHVSVFYVVRHYLYKIICTLIQQQERVGPRSPLRGTVSGRFQAHYLFKTAGATDASAWRRIHRLGTAGNSCCLISWTKQSLYFPRRAAEPISGDFNVQSALRLADDEPIGVLETRLPRIRTCFLKSLS